MWWNQVHGVGVGSTSFPKTSCRRNAWNSRSVKPLALWIYSTAILTFRRIHAREFVELVWTCILIKRDEPPKSMKENGLQKIQGCAFLQFFSACDVTNWKLKRWSAHTWQILWNKVKHLFKVLHLFFSCVIESRILEVFECRRHCHWWGHSSCWSRSFLPFLDSLCSCSWMSQVSSKTSPIALEVKAFGTAVDRGLGTAWHSTGTVLNTVSQSEVRQVGTASVKTMDCFSVFSLCLSVKRIDLQCFKRCLQKMLKHIIELDDGKILTGKPYFFDGQNHGKNHGFPVFRFSARLSRRLPTTGDLHVCANSYPCEPSAVAQARQQVHCKLRFYNCLFFVLQILMFYTLLLSLLYHLYLFLTSI